MQIPKEILDQIEFEVSGRRDQLFDTQYPRLKKLARPCDDCDLTVVNRTVAHTLNTNQQLEPHYRHYCTVCKRFLNPLSGAYDMTAQELNRYYRLKKTRSDK